MEDCIFISQLEVLAHVGVTSGERMAEQRLTISVRMEPAEGLWGLGDDIENTIDYAAVCQVVRAEATAKPRRLIETVAEDVGELLLSKFSLKAVEIEVRKYVLTDAEYVAVSVRRERSSTGPEPALG